MIRAPDLLKVVRLRMVVAISLLPFTSHCIVLKLTQGLSLYYPFLSEETISLWVSYQIVICILIREQKL